MECLLLGGTADSVREIRHVSVWPRLCENDAQWYDSPV